MGCDVHTIAEYYSPSENEWRVNQVIDLKEYNGKLAAQPIYLPRNYRLFAALAGVRAQRHPAHFDPRGLPDDITEWSNNWFVDGPYGTNLHNHSWLNFAEAHWCANYAEDERFAAWLTYAKYEWCDETQQRIIFAFDN